MRWACNQGFFLHNCLQLYVTDYLSSPEQSVVRNEDEAEGPEFFIVYVQLLGDKTSTTLRSTAVVANPVLVVLMDCPAKYLR